MLGLLSFEWVPTASEAEPGCFLVRASCAVIGRGGGVLCGGQGKRGTVAMRRVRRSLAARSIVAQRPEIIVMFACAELGSILDPGDDLRCFELVLTVLTRLIKVSRADSIVLKCRSDPPPPLALEHDVGKPAVQAR